MEVCTYCTQLKMTALTGSVQTRAGNPKRIPFRCREWPRACAPMSSRTLFSTACVFVTVCVFCMKAPAGTSQRYVPLSNERGVCPCHVFPPVKKTEKRSYIAILPIHIDEHRPFLWRLTNGRAIRDTGFRRPAGSVFSSSSSQDHPDMHK